MHCYLIMGILVHAAIYVIIKSQNYINSYCSTTDCVVDSFTLVPVLTIYLDYPSFNDNFGTVFPRNNRPTMC